MSSRISLMLAAAMLAVAPVAAHHGAGVFEPEKKVTVAGTVTDFQFVNPHVLIYWTGKGDDGKEAQWGGELTSPNRLARMGGAVKWHQSMLKPGDSITVTGHPARNGAPMMDITKIVDAAGATLTDE
jgi:hydrogenase maturation factor